MKKLIGIVSSVLILSLTYPLIKHGSSAAFEMSTGLFLLALYNLVFWFNKRVK